MKNIMVGLDLTKMDETLIRYAHFLQQQWKLDTIHFVHNIKRYEMDEVLEDLVGEKDIKSLIEKNLRSKINKVLPETSSYTLDIKEHDSTEFSLKTLAGERSVDTILLGFKQEDSGTAAMSQKLIRMFKGDVILVPERASMQWNRILVASDLSGPFQKVLQKLELFQKLETTPQIKILKSYGIPSTFFPYIDDKRAVEKTHKHIEKQYQEVQRKFDVPQDFEFVARYQEDQSVVEVIESECKKNRADLLVMAAKGASKIPAVFIGSTINELINSKPFQAVYILQ